MSAIACSVPFMSPMHQMCTTALHVSHAPAACSRGQQAALSDCRTRLFVIAAVPPLQVREAFEAAEAEARGGQPVVIFLDEIDAMCPRRDAGRQHEARVVAQLLTLMDGTASKEGK